MQVLFAVLVAIGWYYYFTSPGAGMVALVVLILVTLFAISRLRRFHHAGGAAHNVVSASATYKTLPPKEQEQVHAKAIEIIHRSGWRGKSEPSFEDDAERYGFYALAMRELGIKPVCLITEWKHVRNPFNEALNPSYYFATSLKMAEKQGYIVQLERPTHRQ